MSTVEHVVPVPRRRLRVPAVVSTKRGIAGVLLLAIVLGCALLGPWLAPHEIDQPIGIPGSPPDAQALLGTDFLGRDVLSRLLHGGWPLLSTTAAAVAITYVLGVSIGMFAGFTAGRAEAWIMRVVDVFMIFPPLLLLLVLLVGAGKGTGVLVIGVVCVLTPGVIRVVRTMSLEVSTTSYVEAAVARGESTAAILRFEILPNLAPGLIADAGARFLGAIFLIGSMSFLGLGSQPPAANWALMIAENRPVITTNLWSVLAPAAALAGLTVAVNLIGDAYIQTRTTSRRS